MVPKNIDELIDQVLDEENISMSLNEKEQVKSILIKGFVEKQWDGISKNKVIKVINYVNPAVDKNKLNFLTECSIDEFIF